jgi:hypothetical protein
MRLGVMVGTLASCASLMAQTPPMPTGWLDTAPPPSEKFPVEWYSTQDPYHPTPDGGVVHTDAPVIGAPFTGTIVVSGQASVPGRPSVASRMRTVMVRDSAGRTRIEMLPLEVDGVLARTPGGPIGKIEVNDAATHCTFGWVEPPQTGVGKAASVRCLPRTIRFQADGMESKMTKQVAETLHPFPWQTLQIEPLGEKIVAGMKAVGIRQTLADTQTSPGQPQVTEIWWSPEIKEILVSKPVGDATGRSTIEMTDIKRLEPDPALFYPPAGYKIVSGAPPF